MATVARVPAFFAVLVLCAGCATMGGQTDSTSTAQTPPPPSGPTQVAATAESGTVPVGQELDVALQTTLSSDTAQVEQRFEATTAVDLMQGDRVLIPAGSRVRGVVSGVDKAGRVDRTGSLTLSFDQIVVNGREMPLRATATQVYESRGIREEVGTVGTAGAVGGIVGGILGGLRGALLGAIVGSGGVIAATEGKDVTIPAGSIVRIRLDTPLKVS
jgi:hypothetical protein